MRTNAWIILVSALTGTALMTLFLNGLSNLLHRQLRVVPILGTMLTGETTGARSVSYSQRSLAMGRLTHYGAGFLLAWIYYFAHVSAYLGNIAGYLFFGITTGLIGVAGWRVFFYVHPNPPRVDRSLFLPWIFVAHFVFAGGTMLTENLLTGLFAG